MTAVTRPQGTNPSPLCTGAHPVLVIDADPLLNRLLGQWLAECGCTPCHAGAPGEPTAGRYELLIVDVPFPRQGGGDLLRRIANEHPGTPILALSSTFFGSVACAGSLCSSLGVASVLPKPLAREALITAVQKVLKP
jgi:DNA-binding NtrC family response regulator